MMATTVNRSTKPAAAVRASDPVQNDGDRNMSMKALMSGVLVMAVPLLAGLSGGAAAKDPVVTFRPMQDAHLPAGSQISSERLRAADIKIRAFKAKLKQRQQESPNAQEREQR